MAINNRSLDVSEQKQNININVGAVATAGATYNIYTAPFPLTLTDIRVAAQGLSGSPAWSIQKGVFYPGAGLTLNAIIGSYTVVAYGTSGLQRCSLLAAGSTLLNMAAGDELFLVPSGANSAVADAVVSVVIQATQDIKSYFGVTA